MNSKLPVRLLCSTFNLHHRPIVVSSLMLKTHQHDRTISTLTVSVGVLKSNGNQVFLIIFFGSFHEI